jgi:hypothetical protein
MLHRATVTSVVLCEEREEALISILSRNGSKRHHRWEEEDKAV